MEEICRYYSSSNDYMVVLWDETLEETIILNYSYCEMHRIWEMKNMNYDMLNYIVSDFKSFVSINEDLFYITKECMENLQDCNCYMEFVDQLKEFSIKIRED